MANNEFVMSARQAAELDYAMERNGLTPADVKKLSTGDILAKLLPVIRGQAEVVINKYIIDLSREALYVPEDWTVEEHHGEGELEFDPQKIKLYLSKEQESGKWIKGNNLRKELKPQLVLPANVLDFLLKYPHLIPDAWKGKYIFFWGTIYRDAYGSLDVRCLYWHGVRWYWDCRWLDSDFRSGRPAALRAC